ncbi:MAG: hemolysin secretion protein D [Alteromonadaceae bacterium]|nr:MAG: hemolysin secretion protein D [Alteromonadaceae bacterium]
MPSLLIHALDRIKATSFFRFLREKHVHGQGATVVDDIDIEDLPYVDDLNAAMLAKAPHRSRQLLYAIISFVLLAIGWSFFAELDEVTVGIGKVIPSKQIQVVQNLEGGIVKDILVREGQVVNIGQELISIDETQFLSDYREQEGLRRSLSARVIRLKAELDSVLIVDSEQALVEQGKEVPLDTTHEVVEPKMPDFSYLGVDENSEFINRQKAYFKERIRNLTNQLAILNQQVNQKKTALTELRSQIHYLERSHHLAKRELDITKPLVKKGVVSEIELIQLEKSLNDALSTLASARIMMPKLNAEIIEMNNKRKEVALNFRSESQEKLAEVEAKIASLSEILVSLKDKLKRTAVISPVQGTIKTIKINTVGGVIQPGMDLVEIVPSEAGLLVEAKILPKDIGFLRPNLKADIKLTAYDFAIYGGLHGIVEHISADTIVDENNTSYYLIRVRSDGRYYDKDNKPLPIIPGMTATVDVITGKKRVLDYLLKPIVRAKQNALREK